VDGDGQQGEVGKTLASPVVVLVTDGTEPVPDATVEFALTSAADGAQVAPPTATTDGDGKAVAHVLLGTEAGILTGEARVVIHGAVSAKASFSALAMSAAPPPPTDQPPHAAFDSHCQNLACQFDDGSTDSDGTVTGWAWQFGDGTTSTDQNPSHTYASAGTYSVTLHVTDNDGSGDGSSSQVTVTASAPHSNHAPQAEFGRSCQDLRCSFTDRSSDSDGNLVSWRWDFGDGASSTDQNPSHTYGSAGSYKVQLTVRDNGGAEANVTHTAEAQSAPPPSNKPPTADFDVHCKKRNCDFTSKSKDDDGSIVAWQWDFGDGSISHEENKSHTYDQSGHYTVSLKVTDNRGATDTKQKKVDVKR